MRLATATFIAGIALVLALAAGFSVVGAHARLAESTPAAGAVLDAAPAEVSITFSQEVQKITGSYGIDVFNESGAEVTTEDAVLSDEDRRVMTVALPAALPVGRYVVEYKNVSDEDGDPWAGAYAFYVGREPTAAESAADEELLSEGEDATPTAAASSPTAVAGETPLASPTGGGDGRSEVGGSEAGDKITLVLVLGVIVLMAALVGIGFIAFSMRSDE